MKNKLTKKTIALAASGVGLLYTLSVVCAVTQAQTSAAAPKTALAANQATAALPIDGKWDIDVSHTSVGFSVQHMVVSHVQGRFNKFSGSIVADSKDLSKSSVDFTIQAASVDTNFPARDAHLKSPDFFDTAKYPAITFKSSGVEKKDDGSYVAHGLFTMRGVTKTVDLPFTVVGPIKDAFGMIRLGLQSKLRVNRQDYGVKWNQNLDSGGVVVGNDVDIEINLEATAAK